jgi:predicted amidophosphoribosyltransferase
MINISGPWKAGYAFDIHTLRSKHIGDDQYGHPRFHTERSPIRQCLYKLKFGQNFSDVANIINILSSNEDFKIFIKEIDVIVPAPPSNKYRRLQPVILTAQEIARMFNKELRQDIFMSSNSEEMKNIDTDEKYDRIKNALRMEGQLDKSKAVLLFDDVFDSGSTLIAMTNIMIENGYNNIFAFTLTKTRIPD